MLGFIKNLSNKISNGFSAPGAEETDGYYEDYYDDDYEDEYYDEQPEPSRHHRQEKPVRRASSSKLPAVSTGRSSARSYAAKESAYNFNGGNTGLSLNKASETIIIHPRSIEDAVEIGSHIRSGRMCIVDLTEVMGTEAQRIADYLCGNTDALDGAITRVNEKIITVSPANHRVMPDYREETQYDAPRYMRAANDR